MDPAPQIAVWACASLTKMAMLKRIALGRTQGASANDPSILDPSTLSIPCVTVEGHYWNIYMAKRCSNTLVVRVACLQFFSLLEVHADHRWYRKFKDLSLNSRRTRSWASSGSSSLWSKFRNGAILRTDSGSCRLSTDCSHDSPPVHCDEGYINH